MGRTQTASSARPREPAFGPTRPIPPDACAPGALSRTASVRRISPSGCFSVRHKVPQTRYPDYNRPASPRPQSSSRHRPSAGGKFSGKCLISGLSPRRKPVYFVVRCRKARGAECIQTAKIHLPAELRGSAVFFSHGSSPSCLKLLASSTSGPMRSAL